MTARFVKQFVDNVTGDILNEDEAQTISIRVDNETYVLHTSAENVAKFKKTNKNWIDKADKRTETGGTAFYGGATSADVRAWAAENGYEVRATGRIPSALAEAYAEAMNSSEAEEVSAQ
ncbi:Lsr2-like DNA bridging protein [Gordonia phage Guey18]|nr:Lsr2-like DNA bridging protein [Gordonia phage Guey18]